MSRFRTSIENENADFCGIHLLNVVAQSSANKCNFCAIQPQPSKIKGRAELMLDRQVTEARLLIKTAWLVGTIVAFDRLL